MAMTITSTAIAGKIFLERRSIRFSESRLLVGLLIIEDVAAMIFLITLSSVVPSEAPGTGAQFPRLILVAFGGFALLALGLVVARYLAPLAINYLSHYEEEFAEIPFLFALGLGFGFGVLGAYLGYSPGIGAFIIGLSIRGKHSRFLSEKVSTIKDLFLVLFFVTMGSMINPFPALLLGLPVVAVMIFVIGENSSVGLQSGEFCIRLSRIE
jgi:Kef-type K+ transport system membrane component KefB